MSSLYLHRLDQAVTARTTQTSGHEQRDRGHIFRGLIVRNAHTFGVQRDHLSDVPPNVAP